ncbi:MAG: tetratricopeptide repeat protein, partial [Planctomycetota bacterium]
PILIWCVGDIDSAELADHQTLMNAKVQKAMKGFLVVLANPVDDHGSKDGKIDGKKARVCKLAPGVTCADHMRSWTELYRSYADVMADKNGNIKVPNHFVVDPDGKVLGYINNGNLQSGFDVVPPKQMADGLKKMLKKAGGPGLTDKQYDRFQQILISARTSIENDRMSEAAKALKPITSIRKRIAVIDTANELLKRVDRKASELFGKAKSDLNGDDPVAGLALMEEIQRDYPGTDSAKQAAATSEMFKSSKEGKKALKRMGKERQARKALDKALSVAEKGGKDTEVLRLLDGVARKYKGLPSGKEAQRRADEIRNDPERMAAVKKAKAERAAKSALTLARGLADGGKKTMAIAKLEKIISDYPDTDAADAARKLLETLR